MTGTYTPRQYLGHAHISQCAYEVSRNNIEVEDGGSFLYDRLVHCDQVPAGVFVRSSESIDDELSLQASSTFNVATPWQAQQGSSRLTSFSLNRLISAVLKNLLILLSADTRS